VPFVSIDLPATAVGIIRYFSGSQATAHAFDERLRHFSSLSLTRTEPFCKTSALIIRSANCLAQNQEQAVRFTAASFANWLITTLAYQFWPGFPLSALCKDASFFSSPRLFGGQEIALEKLRIDLLQSTKIGESFEWVDSMRYLLEVLILHQHITTALEFVSPLLSGRLELNFR